MLDAKLLVGHALGLSSLAMATEEARAVSQYEMERIGALMARRLAGESVARIIGVKEFYGLEFGLSAATLEPRPDTEILVDRALALLPAGGRMLDLGTGSGCIPIAILANQSGVEGLASDLNPGAIAMARENAARNGVEKRLGFRQGSWFEALDAGDGPFDLITSNPPYIVTDVIPTLALEVTGFDPMLALDGGPDGVAPYRVIAAEAGRTLKPSGVVLVEIGYDQAAVVATLFEDAGFTGVVVHKDYGGQDRVVEAHWH